MPAFKINPKTGHNQRKLKNIIFKFMMHDAEMHQNEGKERERENDYK